MCVCVCFHISFSLSLQPPLIKVPHTAKELDCKWLYTLKHTLTHSLSHTVTSAGKTLMSLGQKKRQTPAAQSSNRTTQQYPSLYGLTRLSMVQEVQLEVDSVRIGTLEQIPVIHCLVYCSYFHDFLDFQCVFGQNVFLCFLLLHPLF